jgi:hypothetical protein
VAWHLVGCDTTRVETVSSALSVRYLAGCAPGRVDAFTVEALGDFPVRGDSLVAFDTRSGEDDLRGLPVSAELFRLRVSTASFAGVAIAPADEAGARFDALVLPLGVHCPVLAGGIWDVVGASALALPGGDVLLAGGVLESEGALARRDAQRIAVSRARVETVAEGMFLPRALAAGVSAGEEAWIVGGAQSVLAGSLALDSYERFARGAFQAPGRLAVARVSAGAARLLDGSVLVAGGESTVGGAALDTLERIATDGASRLLDARLPWPAARPELFVRDDGLVWIAAAREGRIALALFDPLSEGVAVADAGLTGLDAGPLVVLPGGRLALLEIEQGAATTTGTLHVLLPDLSLVKLDDWLTPFSGIEATDVTSLRDGRILLAGASARGPEARVIDVGRREVRVRELEVPIRELLPRDDGSVAELGTEVLHVVREDARTRFDNPGGTLLADDADVLALDAHTRWRRDGLELTALVGGARFELAGLTYEDVTIELDLSGEGELLVRRADGASRALAISRAQVGPALCRLARESEGPVRIRRRGDEVHIEAGGQAQECRLEGMVGPVSLGFRAGSAGTRLKNLTVTRE